ncbi:hypothetical protein L1887_09048 [Cichorium endivia]|nr:hypothetical protein L1887_09048 [Cichorium endivia]
MAPRGRHTKSRTSRMDAAIDAMAPFGFTEEVVIAKMRQLLKEYGGQDGYGFIELDAYCVLLDALLADQDKQTQEQVKHGETSKANEIIEAEKAGFIDIPICSSTPLTIPPPPQPLVACLPPLPPVMEAALPLPPAPPVTNAVLPPPPESAQPQRRKPCHGWLSDVDEKWHFITLPSSFDRSISPPVTPPTQPVELELTSGRKNRPKRRSRWDLMPEDM